MNVAPTGRAAPVVATFRKKPAFLVAFLIMGLLFLAQGLATAVFLGTAADLDQPLRAIMVGVSLFLAFMGGWFAVHAWRRLRGPEEAIVVGPAGLHDRLISDRPLPWRLLRDIHVHATPRGGSVVAFDIDGTDRSGIHWWPRLGEPVNRLFGYGYYVLVMGTEANAERLAAAIARYASVRPKNGGE